VVETSQKGHRTYSDRERAEALAALDANAGNVLATARALDLPAKTLEDWSHGRGVHPEVAQLRVQKRAGLAAQLETLAYRIVEAVTPADIQKASLRDKMIACGIIIEKVQLLRGQPTQIAYVAVVRETYQALQSRFGLTRAEARQIVGEKFRLSDGELDELEAESQVGALNAPAVGVRGFQNRDAKM
jgi:transposase-like protein